jgi:hypothetical protein
MYMLAILRKRNQIDVETKRPFGVAGIIKKRVLYNHRLSTAKEMSETVRVCGFKNGPIMMALKVLFFSEEKRLIGHIQVGEGGDCSRKSNIYTRDISHRNEGGVSNAIGR